LGNSQVQVVEVETPAGIARAHVSGAGGSGLLVLGHGAGGGVTAADLVAVSDAAGAAGWLVARVEQPYRVQGRRTPPRAPVLDAAWTAVVEQLRATRPGPLVTGGRSSGARVACRTAAALGVAAVVCLAFPLRPPRRPDVTRADELGLVGDRPLLVVQGERDPFGAPGDFPAGVSVVAVAGDHALRRTAPVAAAVLDWLAGQRLA
jgi:predicted alpha/beta-hydrolase family hydrolase